MTGSYCPCCRIPDRFPALLAFLVSGPGTACRTSKRRTQGKGPSTNRPGWITMGLRREERGRASLQVLRDDVPDERSEVAVRLRRSPRRPVPGAPGQEEDRRAQADDVAVPGGSAHRRPHQHHLLPP